MNGTLNAVNSLCGKVSRGACCFVRDTAKHSRVSLFLLITLSFVLMFALNSLTPLLADDFNYCYIYQDSCTADTAVLSVSDIVKSMTVHYSAVNGRVLLHGILQLFLLAGKPVFNIVNAAVYVAFVLLICKHCAGNRKISAFLYLCVSLMLWIFIQNWGQTAVWMDGSINYLWGSAIRLAVLLPFRLASDESRAKKRGVFYALVSLPFGILAGATNENTAAALIGIMVLYLIYYRCVKMKTPLWAYSSLIGAASGFAFLVLAPSNSARTDSWAQEGNSLAMRFVSIPSNFVLYLAAPLALFAALFIVLRSKSAVHNDDKKLFSFAVPFIYILGSFGGAFSMLASPFFPKRAWFGVVVCAIIAVGNLLCRVSLTDSIPLTRILAVTAAFGCLWCAADYTRTVRDISQSNAQYNERVSYIEQQKASGNYDIEVEKIISDNAHSPFYGLSDISDNAENWSNKSKASYYGIESIKAK